jgi:CDP-paratose 2-epimerase
MKILVTGAGGLIGSTFAEMAHERGHHVVGIDSDQRGRWFGHQGSVHWRIRELGEQGITVLRDDFRIRLSAVQGRDLIVHCASQPSHDYSRSHVIQDSEVNYMGTVELLEATRKLSPKAIFVFLSTNKVYGDAINSAEFTIQGERIVPTAADVYEHGLGESFDIDQSLHTPFGVSKLSADLMVQEYRRTFGMTTVSFRCGCLTGKSGTPVELQGFLGYLVKCAVSGKTYMVYGHEGYQVRDNIAAEDVADAILRYAAEPKGAVYNLGGGPENAVSIREAVAYLRQKGFDFEVDWSGLARLGDHAWWVTDTRAFERDYPGWTRKSVWSVIDEMVSRELGRREAETRYTALSAGVVLA